MYIPFDAHLIDGLWEKFEQVLIGQDLYHVISDGKRVGHPEKKTVTTEEARVITDRFKQPSCNFIGTSRLMPVPPHFALVLEQDGHNASLFEYISYDHSEAQISRDMNLVAVCCFFHIKTLRILSIPLKIVGWSDPDFIAIVDEVNEVTLISRRPA